MLLKTILNRVQKCKSFVYEQARWTDGRKTLEIELAERANAWPACSGCGKLRPG